MRIAANHDMDVKAFPRVFVMMQPIRRIAVLGVFTLAILTFALAHADDPSAPKPLKMADVLAWKHIAGATLSNDGQWFAYVLAPNEGDSEVIVHQTRGEKEIRLPCGDVRGGMPLFSADSQWLAYSIHPLAKEGKQQQKQGRPVRNKAGLVKLASGEKTEFDNVQRFAFSGESATTLALHKYGAAPTPPTPPAGPPPATTPPTSTTPPVSDRGSGSDLILRELATGSELNIGNVSEFAFDKKGQWLALVIDAQGQSGNGVLLRNMTSGVIAPLDNAKANYRSLTWTEKGDGLAVLRGVEDKAYQDKMYTVVGFSDLSAKTPKKFVYDPQKDKSFPANRAISANRPPTWTEDLSAILFGVHQPKKKPEQTVAQASAEAKKDAKPEEKKDAKPEEKKGAKPEEKKPGDSKQVAGAKQKADVDKPDLVIWHYNDDRLQSQQQVSSGADRTFSYLCMVNVANGKFHRLATPNMRTVTVAPKQRWAIGIDRRSYELDGTLDGKQYHDLYVIDLKTGEHKLALKKNRWNYQPSPDGTHLLYYEDGQFYTLEFATCQTYNLTREVPTSFVNDEDDHPVAHPPRFPVGWTKDGASVLLSDGWDLWNVPVHGGKGTNLTVNGKKDGVRYGQPIVLDREAKGVDLSKPLYLPIYGEWTKKGGIARVQEGGEPEKLFWDDAAFANLQKAKNADVYIYTRETQQECPDVYVADEMLHNSKKLTDANPQQGKYAWSKGARLVDYTSAKGKKLQAALFLPANYEPHKRYPTIVYIYEKLSQGLNRYAAPNAGGFNPSVYTSNGYAVLMPDIVYQINDPGMSAVWCVLPALEAAIATGVVDRERVGLHGHSWGGYQTAFLITQTEAFKAAVAGAPLTDLISMYNSIYWNVGIANQPIFESSQGRFTTGPWDNQEAYIRNSPVYHAKKVKTPLLLLHNDKDGAVDWNQGIEYFNTLRRLRKPVILLQYKGENHGLVKPANRKDYTVRMREFFDHHLRDAKAHAWLEKGVPHLELDEHLEERSKEASEFED
jgi:dienelactone hydrolase/Tol biopolymer transport system component